MKVKNSRYQGEQYDHIPIQGANHNQYKYIFFALYNNGDNNKYENHTMYGNSFLVIIHQKIKDYCL